nr:copia protein [Tanacetum cinerariifolium]
MAFEQNSSKPSLQSLTSGQISSGLELTYAPSTITPQRPSDHDLDILFEPLHNEYLGGQPSKAPRTVPAAPVIQNLQAPSTSMSIQDSTSKPINSSNTLISSHNIDEQSQPHVQQLGNHTPLPIASATDDVLNVVFEGDLFVNLFATPSTESVVSSTQYDIVGIRCTQRIHSVSNGCENCISAWFIEGRRVYVSTEGFIDANHPSHVYKLKKSLYGLKQAPRAWYNELSTFLLQNGFSKGIIDMTLFTRRFDDDILVVQVYVDDIIFCSTNPRYVTLFSDLMKSRFEMSMMGEMTFFLGLQVNQSPSGIFINQSNYMNEILKKYGLNTCNIIGTLMDIKDKLDLGQIETPVDATKYRSMIGALMYLTSSRPDIVHATCDFGFKLTGFSYADYTGCKDTFKSTSGGAQFLSEKLASWSSKKQDCTSLSTAKLEYVSLFACCAQVLWMRTQLTDYGYYFNKIPIYCDSKSTITISCNPVQHSRMKHIAVRYHFIKEHAEKGTIELYFVKTDYQLADIFTKALPVGRFNYLVCRLGMCSLYPQELDRLTKLQ